MLKRVVIALAALVGIAATLNLGFWQWGRAQQKLALQAAIAQRQAMAPVGNAEVLARGAELIHQPVELRGRWLPEHTVYLDNRQMHGRSGFYVVTPFQLEGRTTGIAVQRGWVQRDFQQREHLPKIETPAGVVVLRGRLAPPPAKTLVLAEERPGRILQNLDLARYQGQSGLPLLQTVSVQQTGAPSEGLQREWPQAGSGAAKNYGYAAQWWALAALIAILYVWFQFVVPRRQARRA